MENVHKKKFNLLNPLHYPFRSFYFNYIKSFLKRDNYRDNYRCPSN